MDTGVFLAQLQESPIRSHLDSPLVEPLVNHEWRHKSLPHSTKWDSVMNTCPQTIDSDTPCANSTIGLKSITIKEEINNLHTQCLEWLSWLTFQTTPLYGSSLAIRWFELGQRPFLVYFMQHALFTYICIICISVFTCFFEYMD